MHGQPKSSVEMLFSSFIARFEQVLLVVNLMVHKFRQHFFKIFQTDRKWPCFETRSISVAKESGIWGLVGNLYNFCGCITEVKVKLTRDTTELLKNGRVLTSEI